MEPIASNPIPSQETILARRHCGGIALTLGAELFLLTDAQARTAIEQLQVALSHPATESEK